MIAIMSDLKLNLTQFVIIISDMYNKYRICESVLHQWNKVSKNSHHVLYDKVLKLRLQYNQNTVLTTWRTNLSMKRVQSIQLERIATKLAYHNKRSWIMRKFQYGVIQSQKERNEEEIVALKWQKVRGWLQD
jgi:hypothetical protein